MRWLQLSARSRLTRRHGRLPPCSFAPVQVQVQAGRGIEVPERELPPRSQVSAPAQRYAQRPCCGSGGGSGRVTFEFCAGLHLASWLPHLAMLFRESRVTHSRHARVDIQLDGDLGRHKDTSCTGAASNKSAHLLGHAACAQCSPYAQSGGKCGLQRSAIMVAQASTAACHHRKALLHIAATSVALCGAMMEEPPQPSESASPSCSRLSGGQPDPRVRRHHRRCRFATVAAFVVAL